jgi:hypothetical protein
MAVELGAISPGAFGWDSIAGVRILDEGNAVPKVAWKGVKLIS